MNWRASLFTRILVWFLGLLAVSFLGLLLTALWLRPERRMPPNMLRSEMGDAIWIYQSYGRDALAAYLQRRDAALGGTHVLLNAQGRNLVTNADQSALLLSPITEGPPPPGWFPNPRRRPFSLHGVTPASGATPAYHYIVTNPMRFDDADRPHYEVYLWVLALVVVLCYMLATTLARPIRELRQAAMAFGRGELSRRANVRPGDEIGDLGREFNEMANRIQTLLGAERRLLQDLSHELRSPLARLGFAVELAKSSPDPRAALNRIQREADRLSALVNELIDMTRAEGDPLERRLDPIDLDQLLTGLLHDLRIEAEPRNVRLNTPAPTNLWLQGDAALLERALSNVVSNALRHAPEGTAVDVTIDFQANPAPGQVNISVRDHGPGVPDADLRNIFKPFFRVDESRDRSSGGVGLGLAIAERTALLHHGALRAESASPGLRVVLTLPVSPRPAAVPAESEPASL